MAIFGSARGSGFRFMTVAAAFGSALPGAIAQTPSAGGAPLAGLSREEVLRLPSVLQAAAADFGTPSCPQGAIAGLAPGEAEMGRLVEIRFEGVNVLNTTVLEKDWAELRGQMVSRDALSRIAARVECRYRFEGFLFARASIRAQDGNATGSFVLSVAEGELKTLEALAPDPAIASLVLRAFAGLKTGQALNALDVRQGLAIAASLGVTDIRPTVRRSRTDPEKVDLVLVTGQPENEAFASINNWGADALGPWGGFFGVRGVGLLGGSERSSLGLFTSADGNEQIGAQASFEGLLTRGGMTGRLDFAFARARPGGDIAVLDVDAETAFAAAALSGPLSIRRGLVAYWRAGLEAVNQETTFFGDVPLAMDRLRIGYLGVSADGLLGGALWRASADVRKGLGALGASRQGEADLSRLDADPQAGLVRGEAEIQTPLPGGYLLKSTLRGQHSGSGLASFEEFNFGSLNGGPGYDPGSVAGDSGVALGLALEGPAFPVRDDVTVRPLLQLAGARAWNEDQSVSSDPRAVSASAGVRFELGDGINFDVVWAEPLRSSNVPEEASHGRLYVQLSTGLTWFKGRLLGGSDPK
ncbi:MAG: hypothetical protein KGS00_05785 [Alphaproteobacteria bacterium]|nr:hypothetical protein [Alphaproteobacteria bacterium]